jgi:dienelactone hydrolase
MKTRLLLIALSSLVLASFADAQTATTVAASRLPPTADYSALGPFTTSTENNTGPDGTYTIVRPETLGKDGFVHAPIIFGPGIGGSVASMMNLLQRIASHGFVIIGRQLDGGPNNPENNRRMIAGLDWLIAQNSTAGSKFEGKLDVTRAASMGYSVGGTGAVDIGGHKAITTVISIHGHSAKAELHGTLLLLGGTNDVMRDGQSWLAPTYEASQVQTFFSLVDGANHGYPARTVDGVQSGVEAPAMIAWLRYWIYNDQDAKRYFFGDGCVMCTSPWTKTQRKNWP